MKALGLIETKGLIAAIESADAMLKAADVSLLEKTYVGGGLVTIAVSGDVGAVKAAVEAGGAAVRQLSEALLISEHVIPRPHEELKDVIVSEIPLKEEVIPTTEPEFTQNVSEDDDVEVEIIEELDSEIEDTVAEELPEENTAISLEIDPEELHKEIVDQFVQESGLENTIESLSKLKVTKLRHLAREYKDFGIVGRLISKADKNLLIAEFRKYYGQK